VIRESGGDFSSVTGGTRVLSDWLVVRITANPGEAFLDRMISMVESAKRQKTPNEIALTILLVALTLVFLIAAVTLLPFSWYAAATSGTGQPITITLGNRQAAAFIAVKGVTDKELADAAQLASLADETPEGRSIVILAKQKYGFRERDVHALGATDAIRSHVEELGGTGAKFPPEFQKLVDDVARRGSTPLVVAEGARVLGVIELKDIVKGGIKERFVELRRMGIKTIMITGDNRLTAAAIAAEAGVDDFLAEATPEAKLKLIRQYQAEGRLVAMTGDGINDAPALAQADVAVAMNSGTQAAKEAGNMVDLDSNPTKLIEIVEIVETGKVLRHQYLLKEVWGPSYRDNSHYPRIYMSQLRQKLETDPAQPRYLLTESGVGYRLKV
jgi:K+-transporting ATPase ATPase B chain